MSTGSTKTSGVVKLVKLGDEQLVIARMENEFPPGEYNVEVTVVATGPAGAGQSRGCCKALTW